MPAIAPIEDLKATQNDLRSMRGRKIIDPCPSFSFFPKVRASRTGLGYCDLVSSLKKLAHFKCTHSAWSIAHSLFLIVKRKAQVVRGELQIIKR